MSWTRLFDLGGCYRSSLQLFLVRKTLIQSANRMKPFTTGICRNRDITTQSMDVSMTFLSKVKFSGRKPGHTHTWMQILNPSTSAKPVMTKLQNLFFALVNMDIFQVTLKFSLFTVENLYNIWLTIVISVETLWAYFCVCRHTDCLQM